RDLIVTGVQTCALPISLVRLRVRRRLPTACRLRPPADGSRGTEAGLCTRKRSSATTCAFFRAAPASWLAPSPTATDPSKKEKRRSEERRVGKESKERRE